MESKNIIQPVQTLNIREDTDNNTEEKQSSTVEGAHENVNRNCAMDNECESSLSQDIGIDNSEPDEDLTNSLSLSYLPEVVLVNIMQYLSLMERYHLSLTCKVFYDLFSHPKLWRVAHISLYTQRHKTGTRCKWRVKSVMHQTMVEIVKKFSHLFKHLSLEMVQFVQLFDDNLRTMLENFTHDCRLESLSIKLGALIQNDEFVQKDANARNNVTDVPLIFGLIQNAVRLKRLNIISWPVRLKGDTVNIFEKLLGYEKIKGLQSLSIFYVEAKGVSWTERNPTMLTLETSLKLVSHFRSLTHLALRSPMLNNEIILELASRKRSKLSLLQILIVYIRDNIFHKGYYVPELSARAWKSLKLSSPELKVEYLVATQIPQEQLSIMLKPEVPLSSLTILNYGRCDSHLIKSLVEMYTRSLERFICLCDSTDCDLALIDLVSHCDHLDSLSYYGTISDKTVILLAEQFKLKHTRLKCFEFKEKSITTADSVSDGSNDDDVVIAKDDGVDEYYLVGLRNWHKDEDERRRKLAIMSEQVSSVLGYRWQPLD